MAAAKKKDKYRLNVNEDITVTEVRLVGPEAEQLGVVSLVNAKEVAEQAGLDLVEISPQAEPPVCKVMDYGKYRFEEQKKRQASRKKQKQTQVKEIKFRPGTDIGDYNVKLKNLIRFLSDGDKVKVTLRFRGREMAHQELGRDLLTRVETDLAEYGGVEQYPKMEGRQMVMVIAPKKK